MKFIPLILGFVLLRSLALAAPTLAPPSLALPNGRDRAVFVDFISADYKITFDVGTKRASVRSVIQFRSDEAGWPIFDLIDEPLSLELDGQPTAQELIEIPDSKVRVVKSVVAPGTHTLVIEHEIKVHAPTFTVDSVSSGFFVSDFEARGLLERYLPANFEFDQLKMKFEVEVLGTVREESVFTNGAMTQLGPNKWAIEFPDYFNCSAPFFHLRPTSETVALRYSYPSRAGAALPVVIYKSAATGDDLDEYKKIVGEKLLEYEKLFGPFPHPSLTIFVSGVYGGGMEYAGAAFTDLYALSHELAHSYFGRGVMPANGNAGWIDEAMATFAGGPYTADPSHLNPAKMASHSAYFRANDGYGYFQGLNLLGYLGQQLTQRDPSQSMNGFLARWVADQTKTVVTTEILQARLEAYSGTRMDELFQRYVYDKSPAGNLVARTAALPAILRPPFHRHFTSEELRSAQ